MGRSSRTRSTFRGDIPRKVECVVPSSGPAGTDTGERVKAKQS
jgi:hypothetical protein